MPNRLRACVRVATLPLFLLLHVPPAWSQDCLPFIDVQVSDVFCDAVHWMRNANVTLGCKEEGRWLLYCPNPDVTRAQMALFMYRMAGAVAPGIGFVESSSPPVGDLDTEDGVIACETPALHGAVAVRNPRYWHGEGNVSFKAAGSAPVDIQIRLVARVTYADGAIGGYVANQSIPNASAAAGAWGTGHVTVGPGTVMQPDDRWHFHLQFHRAVGSSTTAELGEVSCQLKIITTDVALPPEFVPTVDR